ncbi:sucrose transport protein SUT1 isoform X2 [Carex littledalei]|uniref:Sucrose transport protein SUT1 isoform X2 n=1 Tax=Carex littledalei TaxID=544730 RepID=A0A833QVI5_9POAL|nr:sucrose transport protein SUT1 isoform X2 [Carex littledalei]
MEKGQKVELEMMETTGLEKIEAGGTAEKPPVRPISLMRLVLACAVAGGVQYGWALQLSLLTPYVQTLGLSHALSSVMWICGPIAGFVVQPCVGYWSDRCRLAIGRRRPFILGGCLLICIAVIVIGFSSDIGFALGDTKLHCKDYSGARVHAAIVFVFGFWILDFSNNLVQGPARALMADLSGAHGCHQANAIFSSWMAFGNIIGYASGSTGAWHKWFPFLMTKACCEACANLKGAFLIAMILLLTSVAVTVIFANEVPLSEIEAAAKETALDTSGSTVIETESPKKEENGGILNFFRSLKDLPPGMLSVLLVTCLTWLSWFPFNMYDTDWMGREIYHGEPKGTPSQVSAYERGVRDGAFGLLLNSVVLAGTSLLIQPVCRKFSARMVWVMTNVVLSILMAVTCIIGTWSIKDFNNASNKLPVTAEKDVRAVALSLFTVLGFPLAILYSIPFAVTAQLAATQGGGQGLCVGVLNISIVIPQVIVSLGAGPWDALFGKGNTPAFAVASVVGLVGGIVGFFKLPRTSGSSFKTIAMGGH